MTQLQDIQPQRPKIEHDLRRRPGALGMWLVLAALLHLSVWPLGRYLGRSPVQPPPQPLRSRSKVRSQGTGQALLRDRERRKEQTKDVQHDPLPAGEVIEVPVEASGRPSKQTTRLAQRNSEVQRETRDRRQNTDARIIGALAVPPARGAGGLQAAEADKMQLKRGSTALGSASVNLAQGLRASRQGQGHSARPLSPGSQSSSQGSSKAEHKISLAQLMPSMGALSLLPGGPSDRGPKELEEGDATALNAKEFRFASFFNRLKRSISQFWRPSQELRQRDPSGTLYGSRPRYTGVKIELDAQGGLTDLVLTQSCGLDFLDDEAMAAVRRAAPYLHPPAGLMDATGHVSFGFGFQVEMNGHVGMFSGY